MASFVATVETRCTRIYSEEEVKRQVGILTDRALASKVGGFWTLDEAVLGMGDTSHRPIVYQANLVFSREGAKNPFEEMEELCRFMEKKGQSGAFKEHKWSVTEREPMDFSQGVASSGEGEANSFVDFNEAKELSDIIIPDVLIHGSDEEIEAHPAFQGIYGRAPHTRLAFSAIKSMKETEGKRRNHMVFYGLPGAAKSSMFKAIKTVLGNGAYISLHAPSCSKAGIESLILHKLKDVGKPPFLFIEEIEKTPEPVLNTFLPILDETGEVRKVIHNRVEREEYRPLAFATVNDKEAFDKVSGGSIEFPGALSSRFCKQLEVKRPNKEQMKRILERDVALYGGRMEWVDKCLEIMNELKETDPRVVVSFLDGADRLMDGGYKRDLLAIRSV